MQVQFLWWTEIPHQKRNPPETLLEERGEDGAVGTAQWRINVHLFTRVFLQDPFEPAQLQAPVPSQRHRMKIKVSNPSNCLWIQLWFCRAARAGVK